MTPFERDLHSNAAFRKLCLNDDFASKLYCSLENQAWTKDPNGACEGDARGLKARENEVFSCSFRHAGGLVADLREKGEDYMDWYCSWANPDYQMAHVYPEVESALAKLGWYPVESDKLSNERPHVTEI